MRKLCLMLAGVGLCSSAAAIDLQLRYIDDFNIPTGTQALGTAFGGLSGIDFDPRDGSFWSISDDRSFNNPARFYNLSLTYDLDSFDAVNVNGVVTLQRPDGTPFPVNQVDPEAIRLDPGTGNLYWTSEGERAGGPPPTDLQNPFVRETTTGGAFVRELITPAKYNPTADGSSGIRRNLAFESLTLSTDGTRIYTATENALFQDGPAASLLNSSPVRVAEYDRATGAVTREFIYSTETVAAAPIPNGSFATNGLVEMLEVAPGEFLTVERSFSTGVGNAIKLFLASTAGATDVSGLNGVTGQPYVPMSKTLLLDLGILGITLDNIEGVSWGYDLANGSRSLILVSDNNFSPTQFTQFLVFEAAVVPVPAALPLLGSALLGLASARRWSRR